MAYSYSYSSDMSNAAIGGLFAALGSMWLVTMIVAVVSIVAMWKLFTKAGKPGWAALIPFYRGLQAFSLLLGLCHWSHHWCNNYSSEHHQRLKI